MLKLILLISFFLTTGAANCQKISYSYSAYVRAGFENQIPFSVDFKYDSVRFQLAGVTCRNNSNSVYVAPKKPGPDTLYFAAFRRGKLFYSNKFPLNVMKPEVFGTFGSDLQKKMKLDCVKSYPGIRFNIRVNNFHWEPVGIQSYRFSIIRDNKVIFSSIESSNRFSPFVMKELSKLETKDLIMISEIIVDDYFKEIADPLPTIYEVEL